MPRIPSSRIPSRRNSVRRSLLLTAVPLAAVFAALPAVAAPDRPASIADLIDRATTAAAPQPARETGDAAPAPEARIATETETEAGAEADPRAGSKDYEQARLLMRAIEDVLADAAAQRGDLKSLPKSSEFVVPPLWTETREDREARVRALLEAALGIVTDVPVVDIQKRIEGHRRAIQDLEQRISAMKEKQLLAPKEATLPGVLTDTVDSLAGNIKDLEARITENRAGIASSKAEVSAALAKSGIELSPQQLDLLLDGVLSGDLVRLVATFEAAKLIDAQLARLVEAAGDNAGAARKYFAMHAALFAMLVHAQDMAIAKIDKQYLPRLDAVLKDIQSAKSRTAELLRADNRPDQERILEANRESQKVAEEAAKAYRRYLQQQREQIAKARQRAAHDLRIADNTFETVQASFELNNLMRDGAASFEALQKLEAPTFEQIFRNEELRREFEALTRKLDQPTS
jgi:hypothetical protein